MKFLADENFPIDSVSLLLEAGLLVASIQESSPSISDTEVLERATSADAVLLTFDRDFGDLIYNKGYAPPAGVVYYRIQAESSYEPASLLLELLQAYEVTGNFTVIRRTNTRQTPLPKRY